MPLDALIIGLIVLLICGAACFYLYMRISFIERKGNMMESVIVDLKVAIDALMTSGQGGGGSPVPISPSPQPQAPTLSAPVPLDSSEAEQIPEESFYSSVLEQAHDDAVEQADAAPVEETTLDKVMAGFEESAVEPDLDTMTKNDLLALAEKRGLRAKKSSSREQILSILRRSNPAQNVSMTAGAENGSQGVASLDGTGTVDLGQGSSLE
jgi:hypothetical protein